MAWSTPKTFSASDVPSAADMNTYISDDLAWLYANRFDSANYGVAPLLKGSSLELALNTSYVDIPGCTVTLGGAGDYFIFAAARMETSGTTGTRTLNVRCVCNSTAIAGVMQLRTINGIDVTQNNAWEYAATASGQVVKLQAKHTAETDSVLVTDTIIMAHQLRAPQT